MNDDDHLGYTETSLDLLSAIYRDPELPLTVRIRAAIAALPFEHPKLAVTANVSVADFADQLEKAIMRSGKSLVVGAPRVIESSTMNKSESVSE